MESAKKYGIESLKAVVDFGASVRISIKKSLEDGKFDGADVVNFGAPTVELVKLITKLKDVAAEFGDLDEEEKVALATHVREKYQVDAGKEELYVNRALKLAVELGDLVEDAVTGDAA